MEIHNSILSWQGCYSLLSLVAEINRHLSSANLHSIFIRATNYKTTLLNESKAIMLIATLGMPPSKQQQQQQQYLQVSGTF
jgi:hypothetical protein